MIPGRVSSVFCLLGGLLLILSMGGEARAVASLDEANEILERAHLTFERGNPEGASELYLQVARSGFSAPSTWFNAGTAAYRAGDTGRAVLYYARALRMDPGYDLARQSLDAVSPQTNEAGAGVRELFHQLVRGTNPLVWVALGQILFLALCYSAARTLITEDPDRRGHWIAVLAWTAVLTGAILLAGWTAHQGGYLRGDAVVLEENTITRSEPSADATPTLELPAGTMVRLVEAQPRQGHVRISLLDGRTGFVPADSIERI